MKTALLHGSPELSGLTERSYSVTIKRDFYVIGAFEEPTEKNK